jgi:hypothetical protein
MRRLINLVLFLVAAIGMTSAQTVNVNQIRPSATNGQVVTTVGGNTVWASPGGNFLSPFPPPISGQYVIVYPTAYSLTTGSNGPCASGPALPTGSVTGSPASASITNGPCGNTISDNSWGITWSGFSLPSYVTPANVTAIYSEALSGATNTSGGVIFTFNCTDNVNSLVPSGVSSWSLENTASVSTATGSTIGSITCSAQSTRSISIAPAEAKFNIPAIGLIVYYTGTAPTPQAGVLVMPPLYYNPALDELGVDSSYPPDLSGVTAANLPAAVNAAGQLWLVRDGATTSDCSTGGGSDPVLCSSNGSTWSAYGGGGGGMVYPAANTLGLSNSSGNGWTAPSAATIVALFGGGSCSGFLKSSGTCIADPTTYPAASSLGFTNGGGTAWTTPTYAAIIALFSGCSSGSPVLLYNGTCGSGGGGSGTTGYYGLFTSSSTLGNGHLDDGVTTPGTVTSSENVAIDNSGAASQINLIPTSHAPAVSSGAASVAAPANVTTANVTALPTAPASGVVYSTDTSGVDQLSFIPNGTLGQVLMYGSSGPPSAQNLPTGSSSQPGVLQCGSGTTCSGGIITVSGGGGGGTSPLYGIGGFGNNGLGTLVATYSNTGSLSWGPFTIQTDATDLVTTQAGHVYRIVFYFLGTSSGANLIFVEAGTSGGSSAGYFFGQANSYYVAGSGFTSIGTIGGSSSTAAVNDAQPQIAETYLYVEASNVNRIWGNSFGTPWFGATDTHADFVSHQLQLGFASTGASPTAAYVYDLGAVPTS